MGRKIVRLFSALLVVAATSLIPVTPANAATGAPPNGVNLGFRWVGSPASQVNGKAAFLLSDGIGLDLCGGANCSFDFKYKINGTTDTQVTQSTAFSYATWPTIDGTNQNNVFCNSGGGQNGPYTNYNCFNTNGFGQLFKPSTSGTLSEFSMAMACLAPTGSTSLTAYLYEATEPVMAGSGLADSYVNSAALASAAFTLSHCATSWSAKTFADSDFIYPTLNFGSISLDSTKNYVVLYSGDAVAGTQPTSSGSTSSSSSGGSSSGTTTTTEVTPTPTPTPTLAKTGFEFSLLQPMSLLLITLGYWAYTTGLALRRTSAVLKWLGLEWLDGKIK